LKEPVRTVVLSPTLSRCGLRKNYIPSIECLIECR
jgi:hypothetical protein